MTAAGPVVPLVPPAAAVLDRVERDPRAALRVALMAPGGHGKTAVLAELRRAYAAAGVPAAGHWGAEPGPVDPEAVLLVDDAHLLDGERLDRLRELAGRDDARLVVAYRPWPRPPELAALIDVLRRGHPPVALPPLSVPQVGACLAEALDGPPPAGLVAFVADQTRGVPRHVVRLAEAFAADRAAGQPATAPPTVPYAAVAGFAADLDGLTPDARLVLLAAEAGVGTHLDLLTALLERDAGAVAEALEATRATGLLAPDGTLSPLVRRVIATLEPATHRFRVRQRLARAQVARGAAVLPLVRPLLSAGPGELGVDAALGAAFEIAGGEALGDDPVLAARLYAAATAAGRPAAARQALATALAGDLDAASRLADRVLATGSPAERPDAAYVAAVALAHRGQTARSTELFRWARPGPASGFALVGMVGVGRLAHARRYLDQADPVVEHTGHSGAEPTGPPTLLATASALMARGVCQSVTDSPTRALSTLMQAATLVEPAGTAVLLPDSPAALAALVGLHCAELDIAETVLHRALSARVGGAPLDVRHRQLRAWSWMLRGRTAAAREHWAGTPDPTATPGGYPAAVPDPAGTHVRDRLFGAALRVGLARRDSDLNALRQAWPDARQALLDHPVDLFTLLPLGELAIAAARLGEQSRLAAHLAEADALLRDLGWPALWSVPLRWSLLHAAIIAERPADAERYAHHLAEQRQHSPYATAVAAAAQAWLAVLAGRIDPPAVEAAARGLAALGLAADGARLAGQAAIRTADRAAMTALLDCARLLQGRPADRRGAGPATVPADVPVTGGDSDQQLLSHREREVAQLVLAGLTYKQVGDRLYISAKTVEHHMARIRQRLGCTDRRDLLRRLRAMTAPETAGRPAGRPGPPGGDPAGQSVAGGKSSNTESEV